jgi:hypothetical protein
MMTTDSSAGIYEEAIFPMNLMHDPDHVIDGMLVMRCFFCRTFKTPIELDMRIHLREIHQEELVTDLPLQGKGFDMNYRMGFAIDIMKHETPKEFYDHKTGRFGSNDFRLKTCYVV